MKTYKREAAWLCLLYLGYLGSYGRIDALEVLTWPLIVFVASAFGMDWASKQTDLFKGKSKNELDTK